MEDVKELNTVTKGKVDGDLVSILVLMEDVKEPANSGYLFTLAFQFQSLF